MAQMFYGGKKAAGCWIKMAAGLPNRKGIDRLIEEWYIYVCLNDRASAPQASLHLSVFFTFGIWDIFHLLSASMNPNTGGEKFGFVCLIQSLYLRRYTSRICVIGLLLVPSPRAIFCCFPSSCTLSQAKPFFGGQKTLLEAQDWSSRS